MKLGFYQVKVRTEEYQSQKVGILVHVNHMLNSLMNRRYNKVFI